MAIQFLNDAKFQRLDKLMFHSTGEITTTGASGTNFDISAIGSNTDLRFLADNDDGSSSVYFLLDASMADYANPDYYTRFPDNSHLVFGNSANITALDFEIYHEGTTAYLQGDSSIYMASENLIQLVATNGIDLYHNSSKKFETTTTGVDVTGTVNLDNLTINGGQGSDGQVLTSTGSGIAWENAASGGGTVTSVGLTAGALIDVSGGPITTSGSITVDVDLSELTDMTGGIDASVDEIVLLDNGAQRRKRFAEIFGSNAYNSTTIPTNNNQLTNGAGYITDGNTGWNNTYGFITASSSDTLTNKGGNISQWTNDSGYITSSSLPTVNNGTLTLSTSAGLDGSASFTANQSGDSTFTVSLDLSELTDMTGAIDPAVDEIILLDNGAERRKRFAEIFGSNAYNSTTIPTNNNQLTNGAGYITASSTNTLTNKSGNISQWTNDSGYGTGSMSSWTIKEGNGTESTTVSNGETFTIAQGTGIQSEMTSTSSGGTITITNTSPNVSTNLSTSTTTTSVTVNSSDGTNATIGEATSAAAGVMSTAHHDKLDGIAAGATNVTNNNQLTNGAGYTTNTGDITAVTAGDYLSGGATSGSATLNIDVGASGDWFGKGVAVRSDGVMEVGRYIDFHEADTGTTDYDHRISVTSGRLYFSGDIEVDGGDIFITDSNTKITEGSSNSIRLQTNSGYFDAGPQSTSFCHMNTDRQSFYFNTGMYVDSGSVGSYNEDLNLNRAGSTTARLRVTSGNTISDQDFQVNGASGVGAILDLQSSHASYNDSKITFSSNDGEPDGTIIYKNEPFKTRFELHTQTSGTSGSPSLSVDQSSAYFLNKVYAKEFIDRDSTSYKIHPGGTDSRLNYLKVGTSSSTLTNNSAYLAVGTSTGNTKPLFRTFANNSYPTWDVGWEHDTVNNSTYGDAARFKIAGSLKGYIRVNSSSVTYSTSGSDERLKKNIETWSEDILSKFEAIEPKKFHFKYQEDSDEKIKGYVAQQMVDKFPEAYPTSPIDESGEEYYSFDPGAMAVYLMKAVKDLVQENKQLKQRVEALENA